MKKHTILLFLLSLVINSCTYNKCEKLEFSDSFNAVQHSILVADKMLNNCNATCGAQYDIMLIGDSLLIRNGGIDSSFNLKSFCFSDKNLRHDLKATKDMMKRNGIDAIVKKNGHYMYNFNACNPNQDFDYIRYIIITKDTASYMISNNYKILSLKDSLVLIAPKNIYVN